MQNFWEYAEVACRVKPNFKLPISLTPLFIESQSLSCIYFSYLFLLLLSQTSGQSPDCLVCPWMKRSIWTTCIWALHLCSVSGIHCVWSWWIRCSLLWINGATASSVEHCWFPLPWDLVLQSQSTHFQLPLTVCPGCRRLERSRGELDLCLFIPNVPTTAINPRCSEHAVPAPLCVWGLETEAG